MKANQENLLKEVENRFYSKKEFYKLASKYGNPPYIAGFLASDIIELLGGKYFAKKSFVHKFVIETAESLEEKLKKAGVEEVDLKEMTAFFDDYLQKTE